MLRSLILKCPYANVGAVLVDEVRANTVRVWSSMDENSTSRTYHGACLYTNSFLLLLNQTDNAVYMFMLPHHSAFTTQETGVLLRDVLLQASERDLVMQADLIASCSSLLRFLYIRDKVRHLNHSHHYPSDLDRKSFDTLLFLHFRRTGQAFAPTDLIPSRSSLSASKVDFARESKKCSHKLAATMNTSTPTTLTPTITPVRSTTVCSS